MFEKLQNFEQEIQTWNLNDAQSDSLKMFHLLITKFGLMNYLDLEDIYLLKRVCMFFYCTFQWFRFPKPSYVFHSCSRIVTYKHKIKYRDYEIVIDEARFRFRGLNNYKRGAIQSRDYIDVILLLYLFIVWVDAVNNPMCIVAEFFLNFINLHYNRRLYCEKMACIVMQHLNACGNDNWITLIPENTRLRKFDRNWFFWEFVAMQQGDFLVYKNGILNKWISGEYEKWSPRRFHL